MEEDESMLSVDNQASGEIVAMELEATSLSDDEDDEDGQNEDFQEPAAASVLPDCLGRKAHLSFPIFQNGRYKNPWKSTHKSRLRRLFKFLFFSLEEKWGPKNQDLARTLPVVQPDLTEFDEPPLSGVRHMWVGHSTSLIQFDGVTFLTDPIFSDRCSPVKFMGIRRYRPAPCSVEQLPVIHFVLISHSHYDHLDYATVVALNQKYGVGLRWYVPSGLGSWMAESGCANVVELTWWQEHTFIEDLNITVICTPAKHWSCRTASDENKALWCSWCVVGPKHSVHFSGDSGYCEAFRQIGQRYGPFTLATLPIGAYSPRDSLSSMHLDPASAVDVHHDIQAQTSIGVHWGTFALTQEPYLEPKELLEAEVEKRSMDPSTFITVKHGEVVLIGGDDYHDVD